MEKLYISIKDGDPLKEINIKWLYLIPIIAIICTALVLLGLVWLLEWFIK